MRGRVADEQDKGQADADHSRSRFVILPLCHCPAHIPSPLVLEPVLLLTTPSPHSTSTAHRRSSPPPHSLLI
jgi:hypothetical protein